MDILPSSHNDEAIRVEFFGDEIEELSIIDVLTGKTKKVVDSLSIYPNSHYVTEQKDMRQMITQILEELGVRLRELKAQGKHVEYQRLEQRTMHDVELFEQLGYCPGVENYSRFLTGAKPGEAPPTLLDYFPDDFITIIDESHITVPQIGGMFRGDRARKQNLVDYGFRLPAALDNRPLQFDEFLERTKSIIHVSATPGKYELEHTEQTVEQIIRPTGLIDPEIQIRPAKNQVDDLYTEIKKTIAEGYRVLVTTITKKMSEDLSIYYKEIGLKVRYLHSDIDSLERSEILRELRSGEFDVLIGINLLREGLDLPEVKLVAVLDADKRGFLRSRSSLIQTVGRAARNSEGYVIFYADSITDAMQACMDETTRRRDIQIAHNKKMGITPTTINKKMQPGLREIYGLTTKEEEQEAKQLEMLKELKIKSLAELERQIIKKRKEMKKAASDLDFEKAAELRDQIAVLRDQRLAYGE